MPTFYFERKSKKKSMLQCEDILFFLYYCEITMLCKNDYHGKHSKRVTGVSRFQISGVPFCLSSRNGKYSRRTHSTTESNGQRNSQKR